MSDPKARDQQTTRFQLSLGEDAIGQRLDRALADLVAQRDGAISRSRLAASFARGQVRIAGKAATPSMRVDAPLSVELELEALAPPARAEAEDLPLTVLYEDQALLVLIKPAGMVVHASAGHERGTLVNAVLHHLQVEAEALPVLPGNDGTRPGIVHRLDKDTSGVMVVAKTALAAQRLAEDFSRHDIERVYRCFVRGSPPWTQKRVVSGHQRDPKDRRRFVPGAGGREAITVFRRELACGDAAELTATLETGRTHQIRMHARALGFPLLADPLYGTRARARLVGLEEALGRTALHAESLGFRHPEGGDFLRFLAPLPADLVTLRAALQSGSPVPCTR